MDLILITNDPARAACAQAAGVDRVMIDLEVNGKDARQGHLDTVISRHTLADLEPVRAVLGTTELLVRVNPLEAGSRDEIDRCIAGGARTIMLPMFTRAAEVRRFVELVGGRARTCLLLETPQAFVRADDVLDCPGIDEVHIGLNDLHLGMGLTFMFELLAHGIVERLAGQLASRGIKFGFGGVARVGGGPLSARLVLSEHVRLGSSQVILSRDFQKIFEEPGPAAARFATEVRVLRDNLADLKGNSAAQLAENAREVQRVVKALVEKKSPPPP
jgi:hypothetical protein